MKLTTAMKYRELCNYHHHLLQHQQHQQEKQHNIIINIIININITTPHHFQSICIYLSIYLSIYLYLATISLESRIMLRVFSSHRIGHRPGEAERRRHGFRVLSEDEPEVDMKHLTIRLHLYMRRIDVMIDVIT